MGRLIGLINQKGGVGKTTSTVNLGAALCRLKRKVLLVDTDPQANLSYHLFGTKIYNLDKSIYNVLMGNAKIEDVLIERKDELKIVPSNLNLSGVEVELANTVGREILLRDALKELRNKYDYILVDCPPSLGILTLNTLVAVREVFIPLQAEFFALQGISKLLEVIDVVKKRLNNSLEITGILICMYDIRRSLTKEVMEKIKEYFKDKVFNTVIRENVSLAEAPSYGETIFEYAPSSHGAQDYLRLAKEVIGHE